MATNWLNLPSQVDLLLADMAGLKQQLTQLSKQVAQQGAKEMAELDDLKAAVSGVVANQQQQTANQQQATADIEAAVTKLMQSIQTGVDPTEVEAQAQIIKSANDAMQTSNAAMQAELQKLESTLNPPTPIP